MKIHGSSSVIVALSANNWWERSPNGSNSTNFCIVNSNGNANNNNASNSNGVSFGVRKHRTDQVALWGETSTFTEGELVPCLTAKISPSDAASWTLLAWRRMCGSSVSWLDPMQLEPAPDNNTVRRATLKS